MLKYISYLADPRLNILFEHWYNYSNGRSFEFIVAEFEVVQSRLLVHWLVALLLVFLIAILLGKILYSDSSARSWRTAAGSLALATAAIAINYSIFFSPRFLFFVTRKMYEFPSANSFLIGNAIVLLLLLLFGLVLLKWLTQFLKPR